MMSVVDGHRDRRDTYDSNITLAHQWAGGLLATHRTARDGDTHQWTKIFDEPSPGIDVARNLPDSHRQCGLVHACYLFVGSAAYSKGDVVFVVSPTLLSDHAGSFSPFDTGALAQRYLTTTPPDKLSTARKRQAVLSKHSGAIQDVVSFMGHYLAAHFHHPKHYIVYGQTSAPGFSQYHGLVSKDNDRRAWTVEIRLTERLPFSETHIPETIWLARRELESDIPRAFKRRVRFVPTPKNGAAPDLTKHVAQYLLVRAEEHVRSSS